MTEEVASFYPGLDTVSPIFDNLYLVSLQEIFTKNPETVRLYGSRMTGLEPIDSDRANRYVKTYASINRMVEIHRKGGSVIVHHFTDTLSIYRHITNHLEFWKYTIDFSVNRPKVPYEDLLALDRLADAVYQHAKYLGYEIEEAEDKLNSYNIYFTSEKSKVVSPSEQKRFSFADIIKSDANRINQRRSGS